MDKVVPLSSTHPILGEASPEEVVRMLEDLLQRARSGEVKGVAVTYVGANDGVYLAVKEGCASMAMIVAGVSALSWEVGKRWDCG